MAFRHLHIKKKSRHLRSKNL